MLRIIFKTFFSITLCWLGIAAAPIVLAQSIAVIDTSQLSGLRPVQRTWDELKVLQSQHLIPMSEARVGDCPEWGVFAPQPDNTVYQNLLYSNYLWNEYELPSGDRCLELKVPDAGFLSAADAHALLSASEHYRFEEQGYLAENESLLLALQDAMLQAPCIDGSASSSLETIGTAPLTALSHKAGGFSYGTEGEDDADKPMSADALHRYRPDFPAQLRFDCGAAFDPAEAHTRSPMGSAKAVIGTDSRYEIPRLAPGALAFPDSWTAYLFPSPNAGSVCFVGASGFYVNEWSLLTAAHVTNTGSCISEDYFAIPFALPLVVDVLRVFRASSYAPGVTSHDYSLMQVESAVPFPGYPRVEVLPPFNTSSVPSLEVFGYPAVVRNQPVPAGTLYGGRGAVESSLSNVAGFWVHEADTSAGQSGGLIYSADFPSHALGVHVGSVMDNSTGMIFNAGPILRGTVAHEVHSWMVPPPPFRVDIAVPQPGGIFDIRHIGLPNWSSAINSIAAVSATETKADVPELIWESDLGGVFGNGTDVDAETWRHALKPGLHRIRVHAGAPATVSADEVVVELLGPTGRFTSPAEETATCFLGEKYHQVADSCAIQVSWTTDSAPDAVLWDAGVGSIVASGSTGSLSWNAGSQGSVLQLYDSPAREFLLDEVTVRGVVDASPKVQYRGARCADGYCVGFWGRNFAPDVCVDIRESHAGGAPIVAQVCGSAIERIYHSQNDTYSLGFALEDPFLQTRFNGAGLFFWVVNPSDGEFVGDYPLRRPRGDIFLHLATTCSVNAADQTCNATVNGSFEDIRYACLWRKDDQQLISCTGDDDFLAPVPVGVELEEFELRAHALRAEDTAGWPANHEAVYADSPFLDNLIVGAIGPDPFEEDDTAAQWKPYSGGLELRNFSDDRFDWIGAHVAGPVTFQARNLRNRVEACLKVYRANDAGTGPDGPLLAEDCRFDTDVTSTVSLTLPEDDYLIQMINLLDLSGADTQYSFEIRNDALPNVVPALGNWYNPNRSGNGIDLFEVPDGRLGLAWYTYLPDGSPIWYQSDLALVDQGVWQAGLKKASWNGTAATLTTVGSVRLDFTGPTEAWFSWTLEGQSGGEPFEHLFGVGDRGGAWFAPSEPGWGIEALEQGGILGAVVTFYEGSRPTWAGGTAAAGNDVTLPLRRRNGVGLCPSCGGGSSTPPPSVPVGTLRLQIQAGASTGVGTTVITTPGGTTWNRGPLSLQRLTSP